MSSIRTEKIGNLIREILSSALLFEVKDPAIRDLSITDVEVSGDLSQAKIFFYSHDQSAEHIRKLKSGLERAKGFLRRKLAQELTIRITPDLQFHVDNTLEKAASIEKVLQQALAEDEEMRKARGGKDAVDQENLSTYREPKQKLRQLDEDEENDRRSFRAKSMISGQGTKKKSADKLDPDLENEDDLDDSSYDASDDSSYDDSDDDSSYDDSDDDSSYDDSDDDSSYDDSDDDSDDDSSYDDSDDDSDDDSSYDDSEDSSYDDSDDSEEDL